MLNRSVLLFDPDPQAADILGEQLRHAGFAIQVTSDEDLAASIAGGKTFASIVVIAGLADSQMRRCLHRIRVADPHAWLIVIASPAPDGGGQAVRDLGGNAAMNVPFTVADLAQRLSMRPVRAI